MSRKKTKIMGWFLSVVVVSGLMSQAVIAAEENLEPVSQTIVSVETLESGIETYSLPVTQIDNSKKGIQGNEFMTLSDSSDWGIKHALLNIPLNLIANAESEATEYTYNGRTYQFHGIGGIRQAVRQMNERGITVSLVLLLQWDTRNMDMMVNGTPGHTYYGINGESERVNAAFHYLAEVFGTLECHADYWILGNEVNMPLAYNWTGSVDPQYNADVYAKGMRALYNAIDSQNKAIPSKPQAKVCVSVDHSWCHNDEGRGIGVKDFLGRFNASINSLQQGIPWGIAYHAYAAIMNPTDSHFTVSERSLWGNNRFTPNNENADFVTAANLEVLTNYVKNNFGVQHKIILSEQGFDARGGEAYQSACMAFTYYKAQFNDMIEAVIFRALNDSGNDGEFKLGIRGRNAENVFKYMDTDGYLSATRTCLSTIGVSGWSDLVTGFSMPGMGYVDVNTGDWFYEPVKYMYSNSIMTGTDGSHFDPVGNLSRAQFATILYRMDNSPEVEYQSIFPDVQNGFFYSIPVTWANQKKIVSGYMNGNFGPADYLTREDIAVMMFRYAKNYKQFDVSASNDLSGFPDKDSVSTYAVEAMHWAVGSGLISGNAGRIDPQGLASRAQAATIIMRFMEYYESN